MKTTKIRTFLFAAAILFSFSVFAQTSKDYSVVTSVEVDESTPSITVNFEAHTAATSYQVYRKDFGTTGWGAPIQTLAGGSTNTFTDETVTVGKSYEYFIFKKGSNGFQGFGYVNAGINMAAEHHKGSVLVLIDSAMDADITTDIELMKADLTGDGYNVIAVVIPSSKDHIYTKAQIEAVRNQTADLRSIYIIGNVHVPYSGTYCLDNKWNIPPDGHSNHCGSWAADVFYGIFDANWTDVDSVSTDVSVTWKPWNRNVSSDGNFDEIELPGKVTLEVGRVDLSNLPAFAKSEAALTAQYIQKNHKYRHVITRPIMKTLIDENFNPSVEAFAGNGYRSFGAIAGINNIFDQEDYFTTMKSNQYLAAYATGPGTFTSAGGIGSTDSFAIHQGAAYFNMIFGSYFGDWDNKNAFLRAALAVENGGLTNAWVGRPWWHLHPFAYNQSMGYCAQLAQNNTTEYISGYFENNIHVSLMGDPTLRLHMFEPPTNISLTPTDGNKKVTISWTSSVATNVEGYNLYFSLSKYGPYTRINKELITTTSIEHNAPAAGTIYYMVRAERKEVTLSGSFQNLSQGVMGSVNNMVPSSIESLTHKISDLKLYPNPSNGSFTIQYTALEGAAATLEIFSSNGLLVHHELLIGNGPQTHKIATSSLSSGLYLAKINGATARLIVQ